MFEVVMDLDASQYDERATVYEVTITDVEIDEESVVIHYEVGYNAYYGCRDLYNAGTAEDLAISDKHQGNRVEFERKFQGNEYPLMMNFEAILRRPFGFHSKAPGHDRPWG